jgi:hypothetical protein
MVLTALTMLAGVGGLSTRLGLTPDDVTLIVGALGFIATAVRTFARRRARAAERRRMERFTRYGDIPLAKGGQHAPTNPNMPSPKHGGLTPNEAAAAQERMRRGDVPLAGASRPQGQPYQQDAQASALENEKP